MNVNIVAFLSAHIETVNGQDIRLSAKVALLTRNIKIVGEEYNELISESFGARVIVGQLFIGGETHSGQFHSQFTSNSGYIDMIIIFYSLLYNLLIIALQAEGDLK